MYLFLPSNELIDRARMRVSALINMMRQMRPPGGDLIGEQRIAHLVHTLLEPAEAILRHALLLLAIRFLPRFPKPAADTASPPRCPSADAPLAARDSAPLFHLLDPAPRPPAEHPRPAHAAPGMRAAPKPAPTPDEVLAALNAGFEDRLAALTAAWADPRAAARRFLARPRRNKPATCPVSLTMPEGLNDMRTPAFRQIFHEIAENTEAYWPRLIDSS